MAFQIYKSGQGKYTRLCSGFGFGFIAAIGCYQLYNTLQAVDFGPNEQVSLWIRTMLPAGLFVVLAFLIFWLINKPSVADFMIAGEGEMKKVSWSSKEEIVASTIVVIVVVILLAALLGVSDLLFEVFFSWLLR